MGAGVLRRSGSAQGLATSPRQTRSCMKCNGNLSGQFVRALGGTFHLDCFKCKDCGAIVASKFFPMEDESGAGQYPLCEKDYFRRLDLLCHDCGEALRGSYITALDRKYHIEHFTCCVCPAVFGPQDSYYEHDGKVYCHYHYSTQFAAKCNGCQTAILKQFVEIFRNGQNQHWHPECYMIHKFWNVRLAPPATISEHESETIIAAPDDGRRSMIRLAEEQMEQKVYRIWSVLSAFEESSAACISDMLLHVSNGAYIEGVFVAEKFIWHVELLFGRTDNLDIRLSNVAPKGLSYSREAKLLCKKIVAFFSLLSKTQETGVRKLGVTQELLSLVTGLAHYLKLLIRISLQGALRLEREHNNAEALDQFLEELSNLEATRDMKQSLESTAGLSENLADSHSDLCAKCRNTIEDECFKLDDKRWHLPCLTCSTCNKELRDTLNDAMWTSDDRGRVVCRNCAQQLPDAKDGFQHTTRLKQYIFLLRVALARLLVMLRQGGTLPHTSDDPNLQQYDSSEGHKSGLDPPLLRSESRSKSYGGEQVEAYTNTVNNIRRLKSTRLDKQLSGTTARKARQSRIIEGPTADSVRPGSSEGPPRDRRRETGHFKIVEDSFGSDNVVERSFGDDKALTLDDIPRIVAAEQAREQRPNAFKHQRPNQYVGSPAPTQPRLVNGHQRELSTSKPLLAPPLEPPQIPRKRYFSELTALDSFIVRHLAVLNMEPLVQGHFNLEELLGLIETNKKTFWGKFGKAFQPNDKKKATKKKAGVFGIPLEVMIERDGAESSLGVGPGNLRIPQIVDDAITAMRQMVSDMSVEGVFRKNGNIRRLNTLAEALDKGDAQVDMSSEGPVQIAALLKKFLRELPDPLLTFKLHRLFVTSQKVPDDETKRRILHLTCCLLPKCHRDCMEILFTFMNWTASFSHIDEESGSKMDIHNLSTVITPNILYSKNKDAGMDDSFLAIEAVHTLIEYNEAMCEVPEDLLSILNDPNLFANNADITTKDILKRYGDISRRPPPKQHMIVSNSPPQSREGNRPPSTPIYHRVDSDLAQSTAWQRESSARPSGGPAPPPPSATQQQAADQLNGRSNQNGHNNNNHNGGPPNPGTDEQHRNWGSRQPSQAHQPIGAG
ncbi:hypothetical protein BZA77DRAFT_245702 [Pyronema omphalodes]|nr:hypothetical protein BZA77DRAFT_245702 [Pyronema omphalodes]